MLNPSDSALAVTKHVRMAPVMEEKKKRRQKVALAKEERKKQLSLTPIPALTAIEQMSY